MVDFTKKLTGKKVEKPTDPIVIYNSLDRAHDKGPLRPAQESVLSEWYQTRLNDKDVIVKLHTGQGKTLIGLLMLQSKLNSGHFPVVYLCPDHFLINQTCEQAKQFGIKTCTSESDLPEAFLHGTAILVTSVQKLFNGLTKFGLNQQSIPVDTVLMDDAHACSDRIREACCIKIPAEEPAYSAIKNLFSESLELQGYGTFADIENKKKDAMLPVPYWDWIDRESEVAAILSTHAERKSIKFAWPLIKDILRYCQCVISGNAIEIEPHLPPLISFGSYHKAKHRIFMSATVTDDSFLVKGLQLKSQVITNPLTYAKETWSGEKMIVIPSLIHETLDRPNIVSSFGKSNTNRNFGIVALSPSFYRTADWEGAGAKILDKNNLIEKISELKKGNFSDTFVLVNRYDGIDLPDESCRILIFDSLPYSESLIDLIQERCRPNSESILMKTVRSVEQGMGRSVRGEKDYSVVIVIGSDLVRLLREKKSREFLSSQMDRQINIGLEIAEMAREDIVSGTLPSEAFTSLIRQSINRDPGWKDFYIEQMQHTHPKSPNEKLLNLYEEEFNAEKLYFSGDYSKASDSIQKLIDENKMDADDKGWYLQEKARYLYINERAESNRIQVTAHKMNHLLLRSTHGRTITKLTTVSHGRAERIKGWLAGFENYTEMDVTITDILTRLAFGTKADKFEQAFNELAQSLGFSGERPDAEWKEGPDNLWALDDLSYLLIECKSEVDVQRAEVNKREAEQMNRSSAWFDKHYSGKRVKRIIIHPASKVESAASFTHEVEVMREKQLRTLVKSCRDFFRSFEAHDFRDLSSKQIQLSIDAYNLGVSNLNNDYSIKLKDLY